ncbi:MAG: hypothetical protein AAF572_28735 [Cyanobacteria bacterium P01_B01_bin.77]
MTTQKQALTTLKAGGQIQNLILLDAHGRPKGTLKPKQIKALLDKGRSKATQYDGTVVIR